MALVTNGTISNHIKRTASVPLWPSSAALGFFMEPADTNQVQTPFQLGGSGGFIAMSIAADGVTASVYHDWGSWSGALTTLVIGRWYGLYAGANGQAAKMMLVDLTTGTVYQAGGTNATQWNSLPAELWLGSYQYGNRSNSQFAGWRLYDAPLSDEEILNEFRSLSPVRRANLIGYWPMIHSAKADCLKDMMGISDLVESGSAFATASSTPPVGWGAGPILVPAGAALPAILEQYRYRWFNDNGIEA